MDLIKWMTDQNTQKMTSLCDCRLKPDGHHKWSTLFVGETALIDGVTIDANDLHFCTNRFCISCDHLVIRFNDRRGKETADYLFLRNNSPDTLVPMDQGIRIDDSGNHRSLDCPTIFSDTLPEIPLAPAHLWASRE
jgi:hypothetical protein